MKVASKIISVFIVILLLACIAGTLAAFTDGYKNWDVNTWFNASAPADKVEEAEPTYKKIVLEDQEPEALFYYALFASEDEKIDFFGESDMTVKINGHEKTLIYSEVDTGKVWCSVREVTDEDLDEISIEEFGKYDVCVFVAATEDDCFEEGKDVFIFAKTADLEVEFLETKTAANAEK